MATKYTVTVKNISTDGTNIFLEVEVFDGVHSLPTLRPTFVAGTTAASIQSYLQTIANNRPTLDSSIADLVNTVVTEA